MGRSAAEPVVGVGGGREAGCQLAGVEQLTTCTGCRGGILWNSWLDSFHSKPMCLPFHAGRVSDCWRKGFLQVCRKVDLFVYEVVQLLRCSSLPRGDWDSMKGGLR